MIIADSSTGPHTPSRPEETGAARRVLRMARDENDRMAGAVPVWETPATAREAVAGRLAAAGQSGDGFAEALSYAGRPAEEEDHAFGFGDLLDMVNPLQHIPVVSMLYRHLTGDEIGPAARVVGGAVYGGPLGAAAGIANVVVEAETGKDIAGNVMTAVRGGPTPSGRALSADPAERLAQVMPAGGGDENQSALSPHFSGFTSGWRDGVFIEAPAVTAARTRTAYND